MSISKVINITGPVGNLKLGNPDELLFFCGPCVIESRESTLRHADQVAKIAKQTESQIVFKSSFDKANRTAISGFRGLGFEEGLRILEEARKNCGLPVVTDLHTAEQAEAVGAVVDVLQIPAFLCRQTDLLVAAGKQGKPVMVKKGQMLAPQDMQFAADKVLSTGNTQVALCERGSCFGYRDLIVDFRNFKIMSDLGCPVVFDATHSVQIMGGAGGKSSGNRSYIPMLINAAVTTNVSGIFMECHEDPENAPSDGPNMLPIAQLAQVITTAKKIKNASLS
jgi:2-dehydro-3-deoxyphosphooctonate aldolase (KDO 8-P synthase)